jgi:hypothetical protein
MSVCETVSNKARQLRYKKSALQMLHWETVTDELYEIGIQCSELQWAMQDDEALLDAMGGNEEEAFEFRMAFGDLSAGAEELSQELNDSCVGIKAEDFDAVMVGLIGNRYNMVGYDSFEEDYFSLTGYERDLAITDAGKRLMRYTKPELLSVVGQCMGITFAFMNVRQKYDYLRASFDILKEQDHALLDTIKGIEAVYAEADQQGDWSPALSERLEMLAEYLPARVWVE